MDQKLRLLLSFLLSISFFIHGAKADTSFSILDTTRSNAAYRNFIEVLRQQLAFNTNKVYGIPVLKFQSKFGTQRFILVNLFNSFNNGITLAVDAFDVSIVAYGTGSRSFFFRDAPREAFRDLFLLTSKNILPYSRSFGSLEAFAKTSRKNIPLGLSPLNDAITNLFSYDGINSTSSATSFLVIIQMISESAKFKFIEQTVQNSIINNRTFTPSLAMVSLTDKWSELSEKIQISTTLEGLFPESIAIFNTNGARILVDSIGSPIVSGIALLLYKCTAGNTGNNIPVLIKGILRLIGILDYDKSCDVLTYRTTHITGRDGYCVDVRNGWDDERNSIQLWSCGVQDNQKWKFGADGTIRSLKKCMTASGYRPGNYVMILTCDNADQDAIKWILLPDGTITNPRSGLVLTAASGARGSNLTLESNVYGASQGWRAGDDFNPIVVSIVGLNDMCLKGNGENNNVWLEKCVVVERDQSWAIYGDGTIRVNDNRGLCVTSDGNRSSSLIVVRKCDGSSNQRWVFKTDGTIFNPNSNMVMDVRQSNVNLQQIILFRANGQANQQWVLFF